MEYIIRWKWIIKFIFLVSVTTSYDLGQTFNYKYSTIVNTNEVIRSSKSHHASFQIDANVAVTNVWQNPSNDKDYLLFFQVTSPGLLLVPKGANKNADRQFHQSDLDQQADKFILVHFVNGLIVNVYVDNDRSQFSSLKLGIVSLFQLHLKSSQRIETDSSGTCEVIYDVTSKKISKRKQNCKTEYDTEFRIHPNPIFRSESQYEIRSEYTMTRDDAIETVESFETRSYIAANLRNTGSTTDSRQTLTLITREDGSKLVFKKPSLKEAVKSLSKIVGSDMKKIEFNGKLDISKTENCKPFTDAFNKRRNSLQSVNLATFSSVASYLDILPYAEQCNKKSISKLLNYPKNKDLLPQLLDIFAATKTTDAIESVIEFLNLENAADSIDLQERFLSSLASAPFPSALTINQLMDLLEKPFKSPKVHETFLLTVGNLVKKYRSFLNENDEVVNRVQTFLIEKPKSCKEYPCKLPYLRALKLAGLATSHSAILDIIRGGGKIVIEAILALREIPRSVWNDETKRALVEVYFQLNQKHDRSARIFAAETLLTLNPGVDLISDILLIFNKTVSEEMASYILSKARSLASTDSEFRKTMEIVLKNPKLGNYHILSQFGFSAAESHPLIEIPFVNASYEVKAEFMKGGIFKRSILEAVMSINEDRFSLFSFGTFAGGLASFAGSVDGGEEDLTAGMELNVLGVGVRPYTFFTGRGEAMSLVWQGAGSEETPIFQGIFKLHDNKQVIRLQNGLKLEMLLLGAVSINLSGSIQVSLWNRNSQSLVTNGFSFYLKSSSRIQTSFIDAKVEVSTAFDIGLEFITDSDFSDTPLKSCMILQHKQFPIKQLVNKVEKVPGTARKLRRSIRQKFNISGRCFALSRQVFKMCSQMS